jgi:hypothetical protein
MTIRLVTVFFVCLLPGALQAAENPVVKLNGGLEAQILSVGRNANHNQLTAAMKIVNKGKNTIFLLLVGNPLAMAVDNTGATSSWCQANGIASCRSDFRECAGVPKEVENSTPSLQSYTQIDPEAEITVTFAFGTSDSKGPLASVSANMAYRLVSDLSKEPGLSDKEKRQQIRGMSLSFPPASVADAK